MSLQAHLENLRTKPEHVRNRIAFWSSFGITAVIFVFWLGTFTATVTPSASVTAAVEKAGVPGQSLIASVGGFFKDVKEMIFGTRQIKYAEVEVRAGE